MRICVREADGVLACAYVSVIDLILFFLMLSIMYVLQCILRNNDKYKYIYDRGRVRSKGDTGESYKSGMKQ